MRRTPGHVRAARTNASTAFSRCGRGSAIEGRGPGGGLRERRLMVRAILKHVPPLLPRVHSLALLCSGTYTSSRCQL